MTLKKLALKNKKLKELRFKGYGSYGSSTKDDSHKNESFSDFSKRYNEERRKLLRG